MFTTLFEDLVGFRVESRVCIRFLFLNVPFSGLAESRKSGASAGRYRAAKGKPHSVPALLDIVFAYRLPAPSLRDLILDCWLRAIINSIPNFPLP